MDKSKNLCVWNVNRFHLIRVLANKWKFVKSINPIWKKRIKTWKVYICACYCKILPSLPINTNYTNLYKGVDCSEVSLYTQTNCTTCTKLIYDDCMLMRNRTRHNVTIIKDHKSTNRSGETTIETRLFPQVQKLSHQYKF
jgi:hypothetical protein